jgi:peptidyl-prolyl cis-trans isomerase SurA
MTPEAEGNPRRAPAVQPGMTRLFAALAVLLVAQVASAQPKGGPGDEGGRRERGKIIVDRVVAIVNDAVILDSELQARLIPVLADTAQIADQKERARRIQKLTTQMLDEMVNEELIVQAAVEAKIEIEPSEINAALDEIKKQNNLDDAELAKALAEQGYTLGTYKQDLRRQLLRLRAQNQLVRPRVAVDDEAVRARYDQMQRRSEAVSAVRLSHILVKVPASPTEQQLAAAKDKATKAIEKVKTGAAFADVAKEASEDEATAPTGGELGWFERGSITPEWEQVVFAMEKNDVRGPVSGPQGLHVFFVSDIKRTDMKPFDQLKEQIKGELMRREMDKQTTQWLDELRKKAYIDLKL